MTQKKITIGLVAHDVRKFKMAELANRNRRELRQFKLVGTGGTAKKISRITGLEVESLGHGPNGGDIRIAYNILEQNIDVLIFFVDTRTAHGHDVQSLIKNVHHREDTSCPQCGDSRLRASIFVKRLAFAAKFVGPDTVRVLF